MKIEHPVIEALKQAKTPLSAVDLRKRLSLKLQEVVKVLNQLYDYNLVERHRAATGYLVYRWKGDL